MKLGKIIMAVFLFWGLWKKKKMGQKFGFLSRWQIEAWYFIDFLHEVAALLRFKIASSNNCFCWGEGIQFWSCRLKPSEFIARWKYFFSYLKFIDLFFRISTPIIKIVVEHRVLEKWSVLQKVSLDDKLFYSNHLCWSLHSSSLFTFVTYFCLNFQC